MNADVIRCSIKKQIQRKTTLTVITAAPTIPSSWNIIMGLDLMEPKFNWTSLFVRSLFFEIQFNWRVIAWTCEGKNEGLLVVPKKINQFDRYQHRTDCDYYVLENVDHYSGTEVAHLLTGKLHVIAHMATKGVEIGPERKESLKL